MSYRCTRIATQHHHIQRTDLSDDELTHPDNDQHLCDECHEATDSYGKELPPGEESPPDFPEETRDEVERRSGGQCECVNPERGCH